jgi:hypothetical protein
MRTAFRPRAKKRNVPDVRDFDEDCESRGELLKPRMLQSSEASTLRANARNGERYPDTAPAGSRPEPPPPSNWASLEEVRMTLAVPLDLVFALTPLVILAALQFLDD